MHNDLALYIQIPFCPSRCHFCHWVQGIAKTDLLLRPEAEARKAYISALCQEIRGRAQQLQNLQYSPNIIYWGGGTASSLTIAEFEQVQGALEDAFDLSTVVEATIEGSPDTVTPEKLRVMRDHGYKRISFGVQSFQDERLRKIGRSHRAEQARRATYWAAEAGFVDINVDLMCGFPDETLDEVEKNAQEAVQLPVTHLSYYAYNPGKGTVMQKQISQGRGTIDIAEQKAAYYLGRDIFEAAGHHEYSMGYFGNLCLNDNLMFRLKQDWLGLGSGAQSLLKGIWFNHEKGRLYDYTQNPLKWDVKLRAYDPRIIFIFLNQAISTFEGIAFADWQQATGKNLQQLLSTPPYKRYIDFLRKGGLVEDSEGLRLPKENLASVYIDLIHQGDELMASVG